MNKKWLIGIVVVVALGVLAYLGTSTDLFKGSLGGGEKGGLPKVTKARCEEMKKWNSQGVLSQKLKGNYSYVSACIGTYPEIWLGGVTPASCYALKKWGEQNDLSANVKTAQLSQLCVKKWPILWYGADLNEEGWSCEAIKKWEKEGVLSYLAPSYISKAQECAKNGTWYNLK